MQRHFKTLIVDDEALLRDYLRDLLKRFPSIEVVAEADSVKSAVTAIERHRPNLIFLDIKFPGESGFDLFDAVKVKAKVVFVTAFDEYAIRAFEVNALDYLLKPINPERLAVTIARLHSADEEPVPKSTRLPHDGVLFIQLNDRYHFIKVETILKISGAGFYTEVMTTTGKKGLVQRRMKEWEDILPDTTFARVHRSTIVNIGSVDRVEKGLGNSYKVYLKGLDGPEAMSRRCIARLKHVLS